MGGGSDASCGLQALLVFAGALVAGTTCSLTSKMLLEMRSVGMTGEDEAFQKPLCQTLFMFLGMTFALIFHAAVLAFKIPFPGYKHQKSALSGAVGRAKGYSSINMNHEPEEIEEALPPTPLWMYFLLIIPALFDLVATALCMFGLTYVNVSIYQMLRGSAIVFVAILKQTVLRDRLRSFMWVGVFWNVVSIVLVGMTAMFSVSGDEDGGGNPMMGLALILCGAFVQSLQYAFEEKVMTMDVAAPPLLLIGMEGLWGSIVCLFVLYPMVYMMPGDDHGSYENPWNTYALLCNSGPLQSLFALYFFSIFAYNALAVLVTFMLNSVWHAILDNFRPITVWGTDLFIFYFLGSLGMGEAWTVWSWLQMLGMFVLLYGTAVYNAPNAGSIRLLGGWYDCFMDCTDEYEEVARNMEQEDEMGSKRSAYLSIGSNAGSFSPLAARGGFSPMATGIIHTPVRTQRRHSSFGQ